MHLYLIIMNAAAFLIMLYDKQAARNKLWRIPEGTIFLAALLGGTAGCIAAMLLARHKTRRLKFMLGLPILLILQIGILIWLCT